MVLGIRERTGRSVTPKTDKTSKTLSGCRGCAMEGEKKILSFTTCTHCAEEFVDENAF